MKQLTAFWKKKVTTSSETISVAAKSFKRTGHGNKELISNYYARQPFIYVIAIRKNGHTLW